MKASHYLDIKKTALTMMTILASTSFSSMSLGSPAIFDESTNLLHIEAIDVDLAGSRKTYQAALSLSATEPFKLNLISATAIEQPGGNRAKFLVGQQRLIIPGVTAKSDGRHFHVELKQTFPGMFELIHLHEIQEEKIFNRIASFPVYLNTDIATETVAEIVDVSKDGKTLIYTDGKTNKLGFVNISQPSQPVAKGTVDLKGEPTSVAIKGDYALVAVNTSESFVSPSGELNVIDIASKTKVATLDLGGQPDSIAVSPDGHYAAVVIENERDEDLDSGEPPQAPEGFLVIVDLKGAPSVWTTRTVSLQDVAELFPTDPEPEYVDINEDNIAVLTFQENNHIALVDLVQGVVIKDFSAGAVSLTDIDTEEEKPALIKLTDTANDLAREPDGVAWFDSSYFVTANEGDLFGGSRGFSAFNTEGEVVFDSGNSLEHEAVRLGHYPDKRSGNKGNEPENVATGVFNKISYIFVASERSNLIFVYRVDEKGLSHVQTLPSGVGPEGIKVIPERNLLIVASEKDSRDDKLRSLLNIYQLQSGPTTYPTIQSANNAMGVPIAWGALSGLTSDKSTEGKGYAIHDSFYQQSRIFSLDFSQKPALIEAEIILKDDKDILTQYSADQVNADKTVNLDLEGIDTSAANGFWLVSEGKGTVNDEKRPVESKDLLIHATKEGVIDQVIKLPDSTNARQVRFGFEGVAATGGATDEMVYVAFQREWKDDPDNNVRLGQYDTQNKEWRFFYYPLEEASSPNGGWVGLSEITALGNNEFAVIERDNQGNTDAAIKRIYSFSIDGLIPLADAEAGTTPDFPVVSKTLLRDLLPDLKSTGGMVLEKIEGMMITESDLWVINDNDGVDDSNGETQLIKIKR